MIALLLCFFFFKQKTAYVMCISDWSSDVCSSDLVSCCAILPQVSSRSRKASSVRTTPKGISQHTSCAGKQSHLWPYGYVPLRPAGCRARESLGGRGFPASTHNFSRPESLPWPHRSA